MRSEFAPAPGTTHGNPVLGDRVQPGDGDPDEYEVTELGTRWTLCRSTADRSRVLVLSQGAMGGWYTPQHRQVAFTTPALEAAQSGDVEPEPQITYTDRRTTDNPSLGQVYHCQLRFDGHFVGTVWKMRGKWSSAFEQDGEHDTLADLTLAMLCRYRSNK